MKVLFYGDSITDAGRNREINDMSLASFGLGYPYQVTARLMARDPLANYFINTGISGNRIVDLYSRIKIDFWNHNPDVASILIGINDIWHEYNHENGVEPDRFETVYRMLISDTLKRLPDLKLMIMEPFVIKGTATEANYEDFRSKTETYAAIAKKLAEEFGLTFIPLQARLDEAAAKFGGEVVSADGVHPAIFGASIIADAWVEAFDALK